MRRRSFPLAGSGSQSYWAQRLRVTKSWRERSRRNRWGTKARRMLAARKDRRWRSRSRLYVGVGVHWARETSHHRRTTLRRRRSGGRGSACRPLANLTGPGRTLASATQTEVGRTRTPATPLHPTQTQSRTRTRQIPVQRSTAGDSSTAGNFLSSSLHTHHRNHSRSRSRTRRTVRAPSRQKGSQHSVCSHTPENKGPTSLTTRTALTSQATSLVQDVHPA